MDPKIILVRPSLPENIGLSVRAVVNMGISDISVVNPVCELGDRVVVCASGAEKEASNILSHADIAQSLSDVSFVVASSARPRNESIPTCTPEELMKKVFEKSKSGIRTAIMFGNEQSGLSNDEIKFANAQVIIPTAEHSSLNLSQAVQVLAYQWRVELLNQTSIASRI